MCIQLCIEYKRLHTHTQKTVYGIYTDILNDSLKFIITSIFRIQIS